MNSYSYYFLLGVNGVVDVDFTNGTYTRLRFFNAIRNLVQSGKIETYPGRNSVWIIDGAAIHLSQEIIDYLHSLGLKIFFLPSYCPFMNPIEFFFHLLKSRCRSKGEIAPRKELQILMDSFLELKDTCMSNIFRHCGYEGSGFFNCSSTFH